MFRVPVHLRFIAGILKTDWVGCAIGGLSGGEEKSSFWRMVTAATDLLPKGLPRYVMGVGYAEDLVVCSALGADMYDCVCKLNSICSFLAGEL